MHETVLELALDSSPAPETADPHLTLTVPMNTGDPHLSLTLSPPIRMGAERGPQADITVHSDVKGSSNAKSGLKRLDSVVSEAHCAKAQC